MPIEVLKDINLGRVGQLVLGATREEGGTRSYSLKVGGESVLPFHHFEGQMPNRPLVALEVQDIVPDWPSALAQYFVQVWDRPGEWARKCVEEYGADLVYIKLDGAHPDGADRSPGQCVAVLKEVLASVGVPLVITGCGSVEKDNCIMEAVSEAGKGERLLLGNAEPDNYRNLVSACKTHGHSVIARSPLDINICKQLNILITEMDLHEERIAIDPSTGSLGYGIEYAYSIMERIRLEALFRDRMLSMPVICTIGEECWSHKEAYASEADCPEWGNPTDRGIQWEATTAGALLQAGGHILLMRHPAAVAVTKNLINRLMQVSRC